MRKHILFKDEEISREIERLIRDDRMGEGDKLPSERQLAEEFEVQRDTVRCALDILLKRGLIIKKPRQGYYVAPKKIEINVNNFRSVKKDIENLSRNSKSIMLNYEMISMSKKLSEITQLPEGTLCYQVLRVRYDGEKPISVERSNIVAEYVPGLSREELEQRGLASTLRHEYGITLVSARQRITQVYGDDMEAELLRISKNEPLIRYEGLLYDKRDRLIEYFNNVVLTDIIEFHIRDFA